MVALRCSREGFRDSSASVDGIWRYRGSADNSGERGTRGARARAET